MFNPFNMTKDMKGMEKMVKPALEKFMKESGFVKKEELDKANERIDSLENRLAEKEIDIGMTYLRLKKYISALKRFKFVVNNYQTTNYTPEALHRLVEIYLILGVKDEALVNARVLGYNFPDSTWYKLSYNLLKKKKVF